MTSAENAIETLWLKKSDDFHILVDISTEQLEKGSLTRAQIRAVSPGGGEYVSLPLVKYREGAA